jgi:MtN3 and saliva related transmembrane protein
VLESLNPEWIGYIGAFFTTGAYLPQVIKVVREKHTQSISLVMYVMSTIGIMFWIVYGLMVGSPSIIVANALILSMVLVIIRMKLKHG